MKFSLKKIRNVFSGNTTETLESDAYIESIINTVDGVPFGLSATNVMYAGLSELAGYHYFKTIIIGTLQLKTFKGAKLVVSGKDFKLSLQSDMVELASEPVESNRNITRIDFEIDKDDLAKISRSTLEHVQLMVKKEKILFSIVEDHSDEEE